MGLTSQEWKILVDTINNTVFENNSLLSFFKEMDRYSDQYYKNSDGTGQLDLIEDELKTVKQELEDKDVDIAKTLIKSAVKPLRLLWDKDARNTLKEGKRLIAETEALTKRQAELEKEKRDIIKTYQEENNILSYEEAEQELKAKRKLMEVYKKLNVESQTYIGNLNTINSI